MTLTHSMSRGIGFAHSRAVPIEAWLVWVLAFAAFSAFLPRDVSYDVAHYQIHNGWALLNERIHQDFAPADMHSFINPPYNAFVWWLIERLPGPLVSAVLALPQALILPGLFYLTRAVSTALTGSATRNVCLFVAAIGFLADGHFSLFASIRNDAWGAAAFIGALALSVREDGSLAGWKRLAGASLIMGAVLGMKGTNLPYTLAFASFVLILAEGHRARLNAALVCAAGGFVSAALLTVPYAWILWTEFANPVFPMANGLFDSPLGPDAYDAYARRKPDGLLGLLVFPFGFTFNSEIIGSTDLDDVRLLLGYVSAIALLGLLGRNRLNKSTRPGARLLLALTAAFLIGLFAWMQAFSVLRYYIAGWMLGPVLVFALVLFLTREAVASHRLRMLGLAAAVPLLAFTGPMDLRRAAWSDVSEPYVSADIPGPERFEDAFILFTGDDPSAFLATQFPASATFGHAVMQDYFRPALENYRPLMRDALWSSDRPVYAVMFERKGETGRERMLDRLATRENLIGQGDACERIPTNFEANDGMWLVCPLERGDEAAKP